MFKLIIIGVILTVALIVVFTKIDPKLNTTNSTPTSQKQGTFLNVSVSGEVSRPGTYILDKDTTIKSLIEIAGGVTTNADVKAYDPSCLLKDGHNYYIAPKSLGADSCVLETLTKVNINTANKDQLMSISGIGNTIASAIVTYRDSHGKFEYLEQIMEVSGIGNATFEKIKDFITIS